MALPRPGQIVHIDCRPRFRKQPPKGSPLRILQWNIERGYKVDKIIGELQRLKPDIIALQEIDVGNDRSGGRDTGREIAEALQMNYLFLCEFEELRSPVRDASLQGGGVHGNGLLSRFDMTDWRAVEHRVHPIDWEDPKNPMARKEPRRGRRFVLTAKVETPQGPVQVYSAHLEVFCGILARIAQFADIIQDSKKQIAKGVYHQAICGDLNTMAHGLPRLARNFCTDKMRFLTLGQEEASFWDANVFGVQDEEYSPAFDGRDKHPHDGTQATNGKLLRWGIDPIVCSDVLNPGFKDPFDPVETVTLDHPGYRLFGHSLVKGKLDWLLLRRLRPVSTSVGNHDYSMSDHKWLCADVVLE